MDNLPTRTRLPLFPLLSTTKNRGGEFYGKLLSLNQQDGRHYTAGGPLSKDRLGSNSISNDGRAIIWRKPPRKVSYKCTFGAPDQGQTLGVWKSQTTESALRWQMHHIVPRHILELTLEVILEHVLGIKTMTWIFNPGSHSESFSLPRNKYRRESHDLISKS